MPAVFRAPSIQAICIPRQIPKKGISRSRANLTEAIFPSLPRSPKKSVAVDVTDHLGRTFRVVIEEFNPTDRRPTPRVSWRLRYTMKALILERVG